MYMTMGGNKNEERGMLFELDLMAEDTVQHKIWAFGIEMNINIPQIYLHQVKNLFPGVTQAAFERPYGNVDLLVGSNFLALHPRVPVSPDMSTNGDVKYTDLHLEAVRNPFGWLVKGALPELDRLKKEYI